MYPFHWNFSQSVLFVDRAFHEVMHVLILVSVFSFAQALKEFNFLKLFPVMVVAVVLHNVGYWFTRHFPSMELLVLDFFTDLFLLYFFTFLFYFLARKSSLIAGIKIPFLTSRQ
jgi:hypothetical protein